MSYFKRVDYMLAGMKRTKPDYRTFSYTPMEEPILMIGGNGSDIVEDAVPVTEVIYDFDEEVFYFWSKLACVYQAHESEANEIESLLEDVK